MTKQITIDGSKIFYRVEGNGKPVMLVHGFGESGSVWDKQVEYLRKDFKIIVPDLPGSGRSDVIRDMSMEGLAEAARQVAVAELSEDDNVNKDLKKLSLIGHSMGGYIALAFAEKYGDLLSSFGLFHSTAFADSDEKKEVRRKGIEFVRKHGAFEFLKTSIPNLFSPHTKTQNPALIDGFISDLSNFSPGAIVSYYEAMMQRPDRTQLLKSTALPVLIVLGKYDTAIPFEDGLRLAHMPEKVYIHTLYHSGHMGMLEEDAKTNTILYNFLSET